MPRRVAVQRRSYRIIVEGAPPASAHDLYHALLRARWTPVLLLGLLIFATLNLVFASAYLVVGGVANARPGSLLDAWAFSVQTLGTIGYGYMYPKSPGAHAVVFVETVTGLLFTALATGLVFVRFSRVRSRVAFSRVVTISLMDGVPTLALRVGNERGNDIIDALLRASIVRSEPTAEGVAFYRTLDLPLVRDRAPSLNRSWSILHRIDEKSPLYGATPESLRKSEAEITISLSGTDDTTLQPVHARHAYESDEIIWGARPADVLSETPEGDLILDVRKFHDIEPTEATPEFPYSYAK